MGRLDVLMYTIAVRLRELIARRFVPDSQCMTPRFKKILETLEELSFIERGVFLTTRDITNLSIIVSEINIALLGFDNASSLFEREKILDHLEELVNELSALYKSIRLRTSLGFTIPLSLTIFLGLFLFSANLTIAGIVYIFGGLLALMLFTKNILKGLATNMVVGVAGMLTMCIGAPRIPEEIVYFTAGLFTMLMDALYLSMAFLASSSSYIQRIHERVAKVAWEVVSNFFRNGFKYVKESSNLESYRRFIMVINRAEDKQISR